VRRQGALESLTIGTRLGPCEIVPPIVAGRTRNPMSAAHEEWFEYGGEELEA